jgi:excisionase family DNA binding protein
MTDVVSTFEAAQILDCSSDNVRRLAREGRLPAVISTRAGRLFSKEDVKKLAQERRRSRAVKPTP